MISGVFRGYQWKSALITLILRYYWGTQVPDNKWFTAKGGANLSYCNACFKWLIRYAFYLKNFKF